MPYPLGFPLGRANDPDLQKRILRQALGLLEAKGPGPVQEDYDPEAEGRT